MGITQIAANHHCKTKNNKYEFAYINSKKEAKLVLFDKTIASHNNKCYLLSALPRRTSPDNTGCFTYRNLKVHTLMRNAIDYRLIKISGPSVLSSVIT